MMTISSVRTFNYLRKDSPIMITKVDKNITILRNNIILQHDSCTSE